MNARSLAWLATGVALVAGCSGGSNSSAYCDYVRGAVSFSRNQTGPGDAENPGRAADGRLSTFAFVGTELAQTFVFNARASGPTTFSDLPRQAGAFVTVVGGMTDSITFNTYLDDVLQQSASGVAVSRIPTEGKTQASEYLSFEATQPFDELEMVVNTSAGSEYSVYEFCADGEVF